MRQFFSCSRSSAHNWLRCLSRSNRLKFSRTSSRTLKNNYHYVSWVSIMWENGINHWMSKKSLNRFIIVIKFAQIFTAVRSLSFSMLFADGFRVPCLEISQNFTASHSINFWEWNFPIHVKHYAVQLTWYIKISLFRSVSYLVGGFSSKMFGLSLISIVSVTIFLLTAHKNGRIKEHK